MSKGTTKGFFPFGKFTTEDFFMPHNCTWFSMYNPGPANIEIVLGLGGDDEENEHYLSRLIDQPDMKEVDVKGDLLQGVVWTIPPGNFSKPEWWPRTTFAKIITNGNSIYFASIQ